MLNLSGLNNLASVGGQFWINLNPSLINISTLENLTSIGGNFDIGWNASLTNLNGLENLTTVGGFVSIGGNSTITSLSGIDNIDANSITSLYITTNNNLCACEVQSICDYLAYPNGEIHINNNAPGCNSQEEVEEACESIGVANNIINTEFSIYPNPATDKLLITNNNGLKIETVNIYNQLGQKVLHRNEIRENIDISTLGQGIYIIELTSNELKIRQKLIIEE